MTNHFHNSPEENTNLVDIHVGALCLNKPTTIEYRGDLYCIRHHPVNPEHARIYYALKSYGEHYVNSLYRFAAFMLHECEQASKQPTTNVIPFPGATIFAGGGGNNEPYTGG